MFVQAAARELFGHSLHLSWVGWLTSLIAIEGGLLGWMAFRRDAWESRGKAVPYAWWGRYVAPGGWVAWSGLLIYAESTVVRVLIALIGTSALLVYIVHIERSKG